MLLDSNILIYAADPDDTRCGPFLQREDASIASVSRIEVLGFPGWAGLPEDRRVRLQEIVASMIELELDENVIQQTIALRQSRKISLADAVIAGTALAHGLPLATRNTDDFRHIAGLRLVNPFDTP
jgi:hypothetical protein